MAVCLDEEVDFLPGLSEMTMGILLMLFAFIPSHVYFIQKGVFPLGPFTITPLFAWIRLLVIHPLLMMWAWWAGRYEGL